MYDIIIGGYIKRDHISTLMGRGVGITTNKMNHQIRLAVRKKGMTKSNKKILMQFFVVNQQEYEWLTEPNSISDYLAQKNIAWVPKVSFNKTSLDKVFRDAEINYEEQIVSGLKAAINVI